MPDKALGLDTSVVLRLLVGEPIEQAQRALELVEAQAVAGIPCLVSDLVVTEAYYALHAHYGVPKKEAIKALRSFLDSAAVEACGAAMKVLDDVLEHTAKPGFVDRLIHQQYQLDHEAGLLTFEKASSRLSGTTVLR